MTLQYISIVILQTDLANMQKKKDEEKVRYNLYILIFNWSVWMMILLIHASVAFTEQALKELKAKAQQKGSFGGSGLKKSGKK